MLTIEKQLGMRIRFLRRQKKMSIEDLALEAEINKNYLSDLERGTRNPTILILNKLAKALRISLSELVRGIEEL
ncbi:MAG: helix-turn-helix domain-containing protein [Bacilli bacterium]|nr:helix-turn-helix domain-containing protein [Bacilli bacterium]